MDFYYINYHVIDNLFYILLSIFVFFTLFYNKFKHYNKILITTCMSIPMILTMKFPIYIDEYCVHDLRQIPFLLGTLYGGWPVGFSLLVILLIFRFATYGFNFLTLMVYITIFILASLYSIKFRTLAKKDKLCITPLFTLIVGVITTFIALGMSDFFVVTEAYLFYFILLPPFVMFFALYIIEILKDAVNIRSRVIKLEKMEIVSQLAASISHEVRNPLTVVNGFVQLLDSPELSHEERKLYLDHVKRELQNAETTINDYLAFAKPVDEKVEAIEVDREITSLIEMLTPLANMNSVKISADLVSGEVRGNQQHFKQCFLNLIKNAIEAMPNGGTLLVVSCTNKKNINIKIMDNGIGMNQEQINRFGEPYYSSKEKGTGLGSMVAVKTIQGMNGTIKLNSVVNEGTTINVTIPMYNESH